MAEIKLGFGRKLLSFDVPKRFEVLDRAATGIPLSDAEIGKRLDAPTHGPRLDQIISNGETVLIVVPDATREVGCGQIINVLVRRLIANGTLPHEINVAFATGIHRPVTESEKKQILTPFIAQRVKTLSHNSRDLMQLVDLGETESGIQVKLNRSVVDFDHVIAIGGINFHYFAGFTGSRKLICPGLASSSTIAATHKLAFDFDRLDRSEGVEVGVLGGNPVHEAFLEVVAKRPPSFSINSVVSGGGEVTDLKCGDWLDSHRTACEEYLVEHSISIPEKRPVVVVSCGGAPHDLNMIQAHKALEMASHACTEGGRIIFLADCSNGTGRHDFLDWFDSPTSLELAARLRESYKVNGQTAWSLKKKTERFRISILSSLPKETVEKMGFESLSSFQQLPSMIGEDSGFVLPMGAKLKINVN